MTGASLRLENEQTAYWMLAVLLVQSVGSGAVELRFGEQRAIAGSFAKQLLHFGQCADAAARSQRFAIQAGGSAGEIQNALQVPCVQDPVRKGSVKKIAGSRGVHHVDLKRGSIPEAAAIPSERAIYAERRADGAKAVLPLKLR